MTENETQPEAIDRRVQAFAGPRAASYHARWSSIQGDGASRVSWNWGAALGGLFWMLYRRMYVAAGLLVAVVTVDVTITVLLEDAGFFPKVIEIWDRTSQWVYMAVMGAWGNYWYFSKYQKALDAADRQALMGDQQLEYLRQSGGTNPALAFGLLAVLIALGIWMISEGIL